MLAADEPLTIGAMVGPEAFTEVRYLAHVKQMQALDLIPQVAAEFERSLRRPSGTLLHEYRSDDAETVIVALGSALGTIEDVVDELREEGIRVGALGIRCFRPWPADEVRAAIGAAQAGRGRGEGVCGWGWRDRRPERQARALRSSTVVYDVVAGLGGRAITKRAVRALIGDILAGGVEPNRLTFLDLDVDLIEQELQRMTQSRRRVRTPRTSSATSASSARGRIRERCDEPRASEVLPGRELGRGQPSARAGRQYGTGGAGTEEHD